MKKYTFDKINIYVLKLLLKCENCDKRDNINYAVSEAYNEM